MSLTIQTTPRAAQDGGAGTAPIQSPSARPMFNNAPEQVVQSGQTMMGIGGKMTKFGQLLQDRIDEATTKKADKNFLAAAQDLLQDPETGYLYSKGLDAKERYGDTIKKLEQLAKDTEGGLENDMQREMFQNTVVQHMTSFRSKIFEHASNETKTYFENETLARTEQYIGMAIKADSTVDAALYTEIAVDEATSLAESRGLRKGSTQYHDLIRGTRSLIHSGVIKDFVSNGEFIAAGKRLNEAWKNDEITPKDYQALMKQVRSGATRQAGILAGEAIYNSSGVVGSDFDSAIKFVWSQEVPKGTDGYVDNDGGAGPTRFGINAQANPEVDLSGLTREKAVDRYRKKYWIEPGIDKLPANIRLIYFDTAVNMGPGTAKELYKASGGDPNKFIELRRDRYKAIAAATPGRYSPDVLRAWENRVNALESVAINQTGTGTRSLADMMKQTEGIADPEEKRIARVTIRQRVSDMKAVENADYQANFEEAQEIAYKGPGGWQEIPPQLWATLRQKDRVALMTRAQTDDTDTLRQLMDNPEEWRPGRIEQYRHLLTEGTFRSLSSRGRGENADAEIIAASIDNNRFNNALNAAGLSKLVEAKKGKLQHDEYLSLRVKFQDLIDQEQQRLGRKLSYKEKDELLQALLKPIKVEAMKAWYNPTRWGWGVENDYTEKNIPLYKVEHPENIVVPDEVRTIIIEKFNQSGLVYTEGDIIEAYLATQESE